MGKFRKSDFVVAAIIIAGWLYYLTFEGTTRFDVNETITLPLLIAAELTALAFLYAAGRYYMAKDGKQITEKLSSIVGEFPVEPTEDKAELDK